MKSTGWGRPDSICFRFSPLRTPGFRLFLLLCCTVGGHRLQPAPGPKGAPLLLFPSHRVSATSYPPPKGTCKHWKTVTKIYLHCRKWSPFKAPQGLVLFPSGRNGLTGILMHFWFSGNNNFALLKQHRNLKSLSVWPPCLKGILETVLALGRKTCFDRSEWSQTCIWARTEPLV